MGISALRQVNEEVVWKLKVIHPPQITPQKRHQLLSLEISPFFQQP